MIYLRILLIISALGCPNILWADIYRFVDDEGVVHFTNAPSIPDCEIYLREPPPEVREDLSNAPAFREWASRYAVTAAKAHDLSPALVRAIIKAESNGNRLAVSPKGARGIMQLMPFTSKRLKVSDPFDPIQNIDGGVKYIKELITEFRGNLVHAVAAYNAGPAAVHKYGGIPPYQETRVYVKRVMDYYRQYLARND